MSLAEGNSSGAAPAEPSGARRRGGVVLLLRVLVALSVVGLLGMSVGAWLSAWIPQLVLFQPFAAQEAVAALLCIALCLVLGMRRWVLLAAAVALWQGALLFPFLWPAEVAPVAGAPLRVLSINLWIANPEPEKTVDYLLQSGADVIGTVETTEEWRQRLTALESVYPYHIDCVLTVPRCGVALFSKQPIEASFAGRIRGGPPIVAWVKIDWQGKPLTVAELQVLDPIIGLRRGLQVLQGRTMTRYFTGLDEGDKVLMGDFNSTPWGTLQRGFRAATGFDNRGRLAFTWPSWAPAAFRLPIDQIFVAGALAVRDYRAGPAIGSDHLPVLADIYRTAP